MSEKLGNFDYLSIFCEKNSDGTKNLRLKGNELVRRLNYRICDNDIARISTFISVGKNIVKLDLAYNDVTDDGIHILAEVLLGRENNLEHLNLVGCNITHVGLQMISDKAPMLKLKTLRLTANNITSKGGPSFENILLHVPTIENLDAGDTHQTLVSTPYFCSSLRMDIGNNRSLKSLDISGVIPISCWHFTLPPQLADQMGELVKMNETLIEMHLQKCNFDGHDMELLLLGLERNTTLRLLDLGHNRINNYGGEVLSRWLINGPNLLGLNLAGNMIGNIGAKALAKAIPETKLRLLDLSMNRIEDELLCKILHSLKKKYRIRMVFLWGNKFGQASMKIMQMHLAIGLYEQEHVDFKIYEVDGVLYVAKYPGNNYKYRYHCQLEHNEVQELRITRNIVYSEYCDYKAKLNFLYYDRIQGDCSNPPECF
ncbi:PREDICTED: leucine-rich repeat-containing protein 34-like [Nicrophorus vespilloides]|uniref:Leucine-rich repeat-containing protein 34-like n=1 Tax=Nicrophorus vespilloides TaxID=110193 RepID=A0ABM1NEV8_NICVS|nr:PREDICTED: leucine-rich repeat-containing protein 34-like [Nicrophorus vespilloides]